MTTHAGPALYVVLCRDGSLCPAVIQSGLPVATSAREPADFRQAAIDAGEYSRRCSYQPHRVEKYIPEPQAPALSGAPDAPTGVWDVVHADGSRCPDAIGPWPTANSARNACWSASFPTCGIRQHIVVERVTKPEDKR